MYSLTFINIISYDKRFWQNSVEQNTLFKINFSLVLNTLRVQTLSPNSNLINKH